MAAPGRSAAILADAARATGARLARLRAIGAARLPPCARRSARRDATCRRRRITTSPSLLARSARAAGRGCPRSRLAARAICDYATLADAGRALAGALRRGGLAPRRSRRARLAQRAGVHRGAVRLLVGGARRGSGQRQAASEASSPTCSPTAARAGRSSTRRGRRRSAVCADVDDALERVVELGSAEYASAASRRRRAREPARVRARRSGLALLHERHDRPAKGVVISHGNLRAMSRCFLADVEPIAPGDALLHPAPLSHGSGLYVLPHVRARRRQRRAGIGRLRRRRDLRAARRVGPRVLLRGADDGEAPRRRRRRSPARGSIG